MTIKQKVRTEARFGPLQTRLRVVLLFGPTVVSQLKYTNGEYGCSAFKRSMDKTLYGSQSGVSRSHLCKRRIVGSLYHINVQVSGYGSQDRDRAWL